MKLKTIFSLTALTVSVAAAAIAFTDVSGFNQQLTQQMSAFCQVASPVNEKGTQFAPTQPAHRDYTTAGHCSYPELFG